MRRRLLNLLMTLLLSAMPLLTTTQAVAQSYEVTKVELPKERSTAKEWLIGSVFLIGCLVVAFKPAKRANLQ